MKSRMYLSMMALLVSAMCFAQLSVGVQGGVLFSNIQSSLPVDEGATFPFQNVMYTGDRGFHFSIPVAYNFSSYFSVQGELAYQRFGYNKTQVATMEEHFMHKMEKENRIRMNYLYTNLLFKLSTGASPVRLHLIAGPSLGFSSSGHVETTETDFYKDGSDHSRWSSKSFSAGESEYNRRDFGWIVGAGVTLALPHYDVFVEGRQFMSATQMSSAEQLKVMNRTIHLGVLFPIR